MRKKGTVSKIVWSSLTGLFLILFVGCLIGSYFANLYSNTINGYFGIKTYKIEQTPESENTDSEYHKSSFVKADGSKDTAALWEYGNTLVADVAAEGATLLWNNNKALPLKKDASVSLFGNHSTNYIYVCNGSAAVETTGAPTLKAAFEAEDFSVNGTLWNFYTRLSGYGGTAGRHIGEAPWSTLTDKEKNSFSNFGDAAIVVLGRKTGEMDEGKISGTDGLDGSFLDLSAEEKSVLDGVVAAKAAGKFKSIIVLINSDNAISLKNLMPYQSAVDSCMWVGNGGRNAAIAIVRLLSGKVAPSGKLVDTYVYDNLASPVIPNFGDFKYTNANDYPDLVARTSTSNNETSYIVYAEGIYTGYRYYETRYEDGVLGVGGAKSAVGSRDGAAWDYKNEVVYPFGYGTSYTTFEYSNFKVKENKENYDVSITVKNNGAVAAKESAQFYLQKPYTEYDKQNGIEKSAIEFMDFDKTETALAHNESETLTASIPKENFKTYDANNKKTYILENGKYYLSFGTNAHDALNNVLAKKGKTAADGMDANGNATFAYEINITGNNDEIYSKSSATGYEITNRFDGVDLNKYENKGDNSVTYLTRKDWNGTYPTAVQVKLNDAMVKDLDTSKTPVEEEKAQNLNLQYAQQNGMSLVMMKDVPYEHETWDKLLDQMTLEEQVMLNVRGSLGTVAVESITLPPTMHYDGPMGLRRPINLTTKQSLCFPSEVLMGATMNKAMLGKIGEAFGEIMLHAENQILYAPAVNIHRSAFSGRNSEYYSEDGVLNGLLAAECIKGAQTKGVFLTVKHFVLNDQEANRYSVGVWANEQSTREVYLRPFETAVVEGESLALMTSYNRIGTKWSGGDYNLLTEVLRNEWGFKGFVVSDAWSNAIPYCMNYIDGLMAGGDLSFTSGTYANLEKYLESPTVRLRLRDSAHRILFVLSRGSAMNGLVSDSKIVMLKGWWEYAIIAIDITFGVLFAGAAAMTTLTFIKDYKRNKKENRNKEVEET